MKWTAGELATIFQGKETKNWVFWGGGLERSLGGFPNHSKHPQSTNFWKTRGEKATPLHWVHIMG